MDAAQTPAARPGKRAEKRRSMEEAVLEHAADMLRGGPEALTIAGLAQRLGVSVGGLYRYYPSKGAKVCIHTNQAGGANGVDLCCPGNSLCALVEQL